MFLSFQRVVLFLLYSEKKRKALFCERAASGKMRGKINEELETLSADI